MYEIQKLNNFIENPMGKGSSIIPNRQLILDDLKRRYKIMIQKGKKFKHTIYYDKNKKRYFYHIIVPSETERNNTYDVVFEFLNYRKIISTPPVINSIDKDLYVKLFSNSPHFSYTYAHIMHINGLLVKDLTNKFNKKILRKPPEKRNMAGVILYDKSIVFAVYYLQSLNVNIFDPSYVNTIQTSYTSYVLSKNVRTNDVILDEIEKENNRLSINKKKVHKEKQNKIKQESKELKKKNRSTKNGHTSKPSSKHKSTVRKIGPRKSTKKV